MNIDLFAGINELENITEIEFPSRQNFSHNSQSPNAAKPDLDYLYGTSGQAMGPIYALSGNEVKSVSIAGTNQYRIDGKNLHMLIEKVNAKISKNRLPAMVMKSLLYITCMYGKQHSRVLAIKLSDLVDCLGFATETVPTKSQIDRTRREFLNSLEYLYHMSVHFDTVKFSAKDIRDNYEIRLLASKWGDFPVEDNEKNKFINGVIYIRLTEDLEEILLHSPLFLVPKQVLALSANTPYSFPLAVYLMRINSIKKNHSPDVSKDQSRCVRVSSILNEVGYRDINIARASGESWRRQIKDALEKTLDTLAHGEKPVLKFWHYGRPLTDGEDLKDNIPEQSPYFDSFEEWRDALIWFEPYIKNILTEDKHLLPVINK